MILYIMLGIILLLPFIKIYVMIKKEDWKKNRNKNVIKEAIIELKEEPQQNEYVQEYPYIKKELFTKNEYIFFKILSDKCKEKNLFVFPKVRMEDYLEVTNKRELLKYRGYIKSRHIDYMIYNENLDIMAGIELDDRSHEKEKAKETDNFKNNVFITIGVPLFRVRTGTNYTAEVDRIINTILYPVNAENS